MELISTWSLSTCVGATCWKAYRLHACACLQSRHVGSVFDEHSHLDAYVGIYAVEIYTDTDGLLEDLRYLRRSAAQTLSDMRNNTDNIDVGGVAIAGVSAKRLGLYAGQRYAVHRLFYRPRGPYAADERRLDVQVRIAQSARGLLSPCVQRLSLAKGRLGGWYELWTGEAPVPLVSLHAA
jgi:hypothetical protein